MITKTLCMAAFSSTLGFNLHSVPTLELDAGAQTSEGMLMTSSAPARPGHFAELEELEAARKAGTLAAYDLFLARHPTSRYAPEARKERDALAGK
jgi:hypothetical protein